MKGRLTADVRFAIVPEWIIYNQRLSDRAVRVFAALARHADQHGEAWPGRHRIAGLIGSSVRSVDRALRELEAERALSVTRRLTPNGDPDTNLYLLRYVPVDNPVDNHVGVATETTLPLAGSDTRGSDTDDRRGSDTSGNQTRTSLNENQLNETEIERLPEWLADRVRRAL